MPYWGNRFNIPRKRRLLGDKQVGGLWMDKVNKGMGGKWRRTHPVHTLTALQTRI